MAGAGAGSASMSAEIENILTLLNTRPRARHGDQLADTEQAMVAVRSIASVEHLDTAGLDVLRLLRSSLVGAILRPPAGLAGTANQWAVFNELAVATPLTISLQGDDCCVQTQIAGDPVVGTVIRAVADLVRQGRWRRVKLCSNPHCASAFYDMTRSRTQRWHSYEMCGNRANVDAYRARRHE